MLSEAYLPGQEQALTAYGIKLAAKKKPRTNYSAAAGGALGAHLGANADEE